MAPNKGHLVFDQSKSNDTWIVMENDAEQMAVIRRANISNVIMDLLEELDETHLIFLQGSIMGTRQRKYGKNKDFYWES